MQVIDHFHWPCSSLPSKRDSHSTNILLQCCNFWLYFQRWECTVQTCWWTFCPRFYIKRNTPHFYEPPFPSIISGSSPTRNTLDGFNMETLRRTIWLTGWTFSNPLVFDLSFMFFFLLAHFPCLTWALMHLCHRELSFTLADDIYIRYLSFTGAEDLEAEMIKR